MKFKTRPTDLFIKAENIVVGVSGNNDALHKKDKIVLFVGCDNWILTPFFHFQSSGVHVFVTIIRLTAALNVNLSWDSNFRVRVLLKCAV